MKRRDPRFIVAKKKPLKTSDRGNHVIRPVYITATPLRDITSSSYESIYDL